MAKRKRLTTEKDGILHTRRKVIQAGESIAITLPKKYCEEHGIKRGDFLTMVANDMITLVKPAPAKTGTSALG